MTAGGVGTSAAMTAALSRITTGMKNGSMAGAGAVTMIGAVTMTGAVNGGNVANGKSAGGMSSASGMGIPARQRTTQ